MSQEKVKYEDPFVFCAAKSFFVRVNDALQFVDTAQSSRVYDFGITGSLVSDNTGNNNAAVLIAAGNQGNIVLSSIKITNQGILGRIEPTEKGLKTAILKGDGCASESLRTTVSSFALPSDQQLFWSLQFQLEDNTIDKWELTHSGTDPVLIWQIKAPGLQPSLAMMVDTDEDDETKLMLFFNIKKNNESKIERVGTVKGLLPNQIVSVAMEVLLDEKEIENGGLGYWRVKVNGDLIVNYSGATLSHDATLPHQWIFGVYQYLHCGPSERSRVIYWRQAKLMAFYTGNMMQYKNLKVAYE
ncbi:MAG: hypothetical protein V4525_11055 [Pseudomonadota bacterium]